MIRTEVEKPQESVQKFKWTRPFDSPGVPNPELLGNKGANLAEMVRLGLPIPPGFTLTTKVWEEFHREARLPSEIWRETLDQLNLLKQKADKTFGDPQNPLIVSVRSGSRYSMPGMLETILNVGLTSETTKGLATQIGPSAAQDSWRRLKTVFAKITGEEPPQDPYQQLSIAIEAVLNSWNNPQAMIYRQYNAIPEAAGTAVNIQEMVFGNIPDGQSGTGVFFTRNPRTGEKRATGEFVFAGQGEDVVQEKKQAEPIPFDCLRVLETYGAILEEHFRSPLDIEWTRQGKQIFLLQSRELRGTPLAQVQIAMDLVEEHLISQPQAYQRVKPMDRGAILRPGFEEKALEKARKTSLIGQGKPASIGAATGKVVSTPDQTRKGKSDDELILVCHQADPNDLVTLRQIEGLVTDQGGTASHLALILQALRKVAVVGAEWQKRPQDGEVISINGATGEIFQGLVLLEAKAKLSPEIVKFLEGWREVWGESAWASALYPTNPEYSRQAFLEKIAAIAPELKKWSSWKAQTAILLGNLIPHKEIIQAVVLKPDDLPGIKKALKAVAARNGCQNIPRSCHYPEKLGGAPWAVIPTAKDIERFFTDPDFPSKYGGWPKWQENPDLAGIIISAEPEGKFDPELSQEHFSFTISSVPAETPKIIVDLQLETAHLRVFEDIPPEKMIQIIASLNSDSPYHLGRIEVVFGKNYQGNPYAEKVVQIVKEKIFQDWWRPPFSLPHLMSALDETYGLSVLEAQGRMKKRKKLAWGPLVYSTKGREEKEKISQVVSEKRTSNQYLAIIKQKS